MSSSCRSSPPSSFSASERPRAASAGRWASKLKRWPCGSGPSSAAAVEVDRRERLLGPDVRDVGGLPHEVGRPVERRHEVAGNGRRLLALLRPQVELPQLAAALGRRVEDGLVDLPQRPLRERRERADLLDLVAEQLDAERLAAGRAEDVDEAAAHRELPPLLHALDPLVAGRGELLGERVEARLVPGRHAQRRRSDVDGRETLGDGDRRRADQSPTLEHLERARTLADEVRRRLEPRPVVHTA